MPFIPLHDENPRLLIGHAWVTWSIMLLCVAVYLLTSLTSPETKNALLLNIGFMPALLSGDVYLPKEIAVLPSWASLLTYQFVHGSLAHLGGNLLFLWVFGDNVEDALGHRRFLLFFILAGVLAALTQFAVSPHSEVTVIGASGAISGVLGAYLLLHPKARVWIPFFFIPIFLPAWLLLFVWFGFQVFAAAGSDGLSNIAWWSHVGGFVAGIPLCLAMRRRNVPLFGASDLPSGITFRDESRRRGRKAP